MELPYTVEIYFAVMADYNRAWFPVPQIAFASAAVSIALVMRPLPAIPEAGDRFVCGLLAAASLWVGWAHQLQLMAELNFMAPVYGWAWIAQGVLFAVTGAGPKPVRFVVGRDWAGRAAIALALFGLLGYPLCLLGLGQGWESLPLAGTAPEPTAILTAGLLAATRERPPLYLLVVPVGWAGVTGVSAYLLGFPLDYTVTASVLAGVALAIARHRRGAGVPR